MLPADPECLMSACRMWREACQGGGRASLASSSYALVVPPSWSCLGCGECAEGPTAGPCTMLGDTGSGLTFKQRGSAASGPPPRPEGQLKKHQPPATSWERASHFELLQHILARMKDPATHLSLHASAEQSATSSSVRKWVH